jgi:hypothetical protein
MDYQLNKTTTSYYEIQYSLIYDKNIWYPSKEAGENRFKTFVDACDVARKLVAEQKKYRSERVIDQYRIVEQIVTTSTESLKYYSI